QGIKGIQDVGACASDVHYPWNCT
ncbi:hypothetical protein TNCT_22331, partial [Trichonephila clavata]